MDSKIHSNHNFGQIFRENFQKPTELQNSSNTFETFVMIVITIMTSKISTRNHLITASYIRTTVKWISWLKVLSCESKNRIETKNFLSVNTPISFMRIFLYALQKYDKKILFKITKLSFILLFGVISCFYILFS